MNRLVREHYPVSKLPEDLRKDLEGFVEVTVTIEAESTDDPTRAPIETPSRVRTLEELFAMARPTYRTVEEVDEHLRALREEWD